MRPTFNMKLSICVLYLFFYSKVLGAKGVIPLILGGKTAEIEKFPYIAALEDVTSRDSKIKVICGGSIIAPEWIITAGHCLSITLSGYLGVIVGSTESEDRTRGQRIMVQESFVHPCYNATNSKYQFDIAMLKLAGRIRYNAKVQPIALPPEDWDALKIKYGQVAGWGSTNKFFEKNQHALSYSDVETVNISKCTDHYGQEAMNGAMLCNQGIGLKRDVVCGADFGGPFAQIKYRTWYLVGIASFGSRICGDGPTVFTKVQDYLDFISDIMYGNDVGVCSDRLKFMPDIAEHLPQKLGYK